MAGGYEIAVWALLIAATITDLLWGKIFNVITLPFLASGIVCRYFAGGIDASSASLTAVVIAFLLFFPLYLVKALAAADVKLLMALGAWSDARMVCHVGILSLLVGAAVGFFLIGKRSGLKGAALAVAEHADLRNRPKLSTRIPFAPAFFCAFCLLRIAEMKGWSLL